MFAVPTQDLRTLHLTNFSTPLPQVRRLAKALRSVAIVSLTGSIPDGLVQLLPGVDFLEVIKLAEDHPSINTKGAKFPHLEHLDFERSDLSVLDLLRTSPPPPHLFTLTVKTASPDFINMLGPLLPNLPSLRLLTIFGGTPSEPLSDEFYSSIRQTQVYKLITNHWPPAKLIAHLPPTIHELYFMPIYELYVTDDASLDLEPFREIGRAHV